MNEIAVYILGFSVVALVITLYLKLEEIKSLRTDLAHAEEENRQLNEQTKIIIQTDLEVKQLQEELDRRTKSLFILHKISRLLLTTLDEEGLISKLQPPFFRDFGFDKFILIINEAGVLKIKYSVNLPEEVLKQLGTFLETNENIYSLVLENEFLFGWKDEQKGVWHDFMLKNIKASYFLNIPLKSSLSTLGVCIFAKTDTLNEFDDVDIEIARILVFQVAQAIDNARLFEQQFKQTQELDLKIKERTKQLQEANEQLQKINRMKSEFVSSVSHELRTPLTSIKGFAALLATGKFGTLPQEAHQRIDRINQQTDVLVDMIDKLLDIARIESGREEFIIKREHLNRLIEDTKEMFVPQAGAKNISLVTDMPKEEIFVSCDYQKIQRVFINLLSNAIKFTDEGGSVTVRVKPLGEKVKISVEDTGIGIPEKDLYTVFDEFYRTENATNLGIKGTGLGLSLVKKIILAHKEEIYAESEENKGTSFIFTLRRV